eukprot:TRINITY_DN15029_c0_g1_i4.p2 TRINITY_DN15029_c0_g1~~TRINITY_DN15029_c0_g1_i4.p2  ORF type:complete len:127 (-),score=17.95 TRINITY_DN15029_c0_g1_i4:166-546(-)
MSAGQMEEPVCGRTRGMVQNISEIIAGRANGVRMMRCATVGHAMAVSVNRPQTVKMENVKRPHQDMDTHQANTATRSSGASAGKKRLKYAMIPSAKREGAIVALPAEADQLENVLVVWAATVVPKD